MEKKLDKKLELLVPDFKLCCKIPAGAFEDSIYVWCYESTPVGCMQILVLRSDVGCYESFLPAPTLAEIFAKLPQTASVTWFQQEEYHNKFAVGCYIMQNKPHKVKRIVEIDDNSATAALRLWLAINKDAENE